MQKQTNTAKAGNNTAKDGKQKKTSSKAKKQPKQDVKLCFSCAQPGHLRANCPVNNAFVARSQAKAVQQQKPAGPKAAPAIKSQPKPAAMAKTGAWTTHHEGMMVAGLEPRVGRIESSDTGESMVFRGCERLCAIGSSGAVTQGTNLCVGFPSGIPMNPLAFGARLPLDAVQYAKFRFKSLKFHYVNTVSDANANANGGLILGFNEDPTQPLPSVSSAGVDAVASWEPNMVPFAVYDSAKMKARLDLDAQDPLFVDTIGDQKFSTQGVVVVLAATDLTAAQSYGMLFVEYVVEFNETNAPAYVPPITYGYGAAVASGQSGDLALSQLTKWYGDTALVTVVPTAAYGGQLLLSPLGPAGVGSYSQNSGWMVQYVAVCNTAAATISAVPTLNGISGNMGVFAATEWAGTPPGPNSRASGIAANNISGGNTTGANTVYSSCWTFTTFKPTVMQLTHATTSAGTLSVWITISRVNIVLQSRATPYALADDGSESLTVAQFVAMQRAQSDCAAVVAQLRVVYEQFADACVGGLEHIGAADAPLLDALLASVGSDVRVTSGAAAGAKPLFVGGLMASAASFLLRKFGPKIAAHLLHMGVSKLERYAAEN